MHKATFLIDKITKVNTGIALIKAGILHPGEIEYGVLVPTPTVDDFKRDRDKSRAALDEYFEWLEAP